MPAPLPLGDEPPAPIEPIEFSPTVAIYFHPGAAPEVSWATLHVGHMDVEIGTVHGDHELDAVLTMAAAVLMERSAHADDIYISPDRSERWVLIGCWLLNARMTSHPNHVRYGTPELARDVFARLSEAQL